jgi:hypothetical protein
VLFVEVEVVKMKEVLEATSAEPRGLMWELQV